MQMKKKAEIKLLQLTKKNDLIFLKETAIFDAANRASAVLSVMRYSALLYCAFQTYYGHICICLDYAVTEEGFGEICYNMSFSNKKKRKRRQKKCKLIRRLKYSLLCK